ncbi:extracellular solute-binding protein [Solihabitans fulvus]|uniref:Extracellular solute-binding protein n=1 Tax=Solihabitans fulvus TaxID=1892852 RepID=A0A5B2XAG9_9PSEU|nr:extracellular solute-binding protein [Solihabitans fulvus]KAA2260678.1 extracellular solute-binding protein [Solihabitans fulvus]
MRSKNIVALASAIVASSLALAACSGSTGDNAGGGPVTLKVIGWKGSPAESAYLKDINAAFEKSHPNVKIDYTYAQGNSYGQKLNAELLGGNAEDVFMAQPSDLPRWAKAGYLLNLSDQSWATDLAAPVKSLVSAGKKVVASPSELAGIGLYSNMKLLKAAGIDKAPTTWSEFVADQQALKKAGQPGLALPDKSGWTIYQAINASAASRVFAGKPNWNDDQAAGKATFVSEDGWKKAMQQFVDLGDKGFVDYKAQLGIDEWSQGTQDFAAGKSAFLLQGSWAMSDLAKNGNQVQFTPWPGGDDGGQQAALTAVGTTWTINAKTSHKAEAQEYLKFWSSADALTPYLTAESSLSPFTSVPTPKISGTETFNSTVTAGRFWVLPAGGWANEKGQTAMGQAVQGLLLGQSSIDKTLEAYDTAAKS